MSGLDADRVVDRREQFASGGPGSRAGREPVLSRLAVDVAALDAGAGDEGRVAVWPVVAAVVVVAGCRRC